MFLVIWDKLFGTFQPELPAGEYVAIQYGLTKNIEKPNASTLIFHEWKQLWTDISRKDIGFTQRLMYLFGPPGYSHDGSRQTSKQLRAKEQDVFSAPAVQPPHPVAAD